MVFLFFGHKAEKSVSGCIEAADKLARIRENLTELIEAYNRMKDVILLDTIRITESLLDATGMSDLERTLWEAEYPKEDPNLLVGENIRSEAAKIADDREAAEALTKKMKQDVEDLREMTVVFTGFYQELAILDSKMVMINDEMKKIIEERGTSFASYYQEDINLFRKATKLSEELRELMGIKVLDEKGALIPSASDQAVTLLLDR